MGTQTCCFCFDLKHGTIAVGVFTVITRLLGIVIFAVLLGLAHKPDVDPEVTSFASIIYGIAIGECFLTATFGAMIIVGVHKNMRSLFIPWMVMSFISIGISIYSFFGCLVLITAANVYQVIAKIIASLVGVALVSYMLWCVCTYYKLLSPQNIPYESYRNESNDNGDLQIKLERNNKNV